MPISERGLFQPKPREAVSPKKSKKNELPDDNSEILKELEVFKKQYKEKEKREVALFSLGINRSYIDKEIAEAHHDRDKELLQLFRRLPESVEFQPGKTLIVGENGSGKSTLAKALFLALKKERASEDAKYKSERYSRNAEDKINSFKNADQEAEESVYEPSLKSHHALWLKNAGLASTLGRAFDVKDFTSCNPMGMEYADFHEIIGSTRALNEGAFKDEVYGISKQNEMMRQLANNPGMTREDIHLEREDVFGLLDKIGAGNRERGSARQTVESKATELIHGDYEISGPGIYFLDEPESGISPMRHKKIEDNIDNMVHADQHNGSIVIIPTNSIKLFESDLPRIDLRYPERGIFRPSQFPDYFED